MLAEANASSGQYLTFRLGEELFAFEIFHVREVLEFKKTTKVPRTPEFMRGVINLRGSVVPVLDIGLKFNRSRIVQTINTCVIIAELPIEEENTLMGVLVDGVHEVIELEEDQISPPPKFGTRLKIDFIKGMGKREDEEFIVILNLAQIFSVEELAIVQEIDKTPTEVDSLVA